MKKEIFIHIGPPKTGTSAIQKWCNDNSKLLLKYSVFYPNHITDSNGVSSGNLLSIYSRDKNNNLFLDQKKIEIVLKKFEHSQCKKLLLSSEFFFQRVSELSKALPTSTFIAYIRNPIEKKESLYNQGVKRHQYTEKISDKLNLQPNNDLITLQKAIKEIDRNKLKIRFFGKDFFHKKNIISDLLNSLGVDHDIKDQEEGVVGPRVKLKIKVE